MQDRSQLTDSDAEHERQVAARQDLLASVLQRYEATTDERLRTVMEAAIRHLHTFAVEVGLTRDEWMAGIQFLTATGQKCDDVRQEFILLSDTLGLSTLVELITYDAVDGATENTVLGPFYVPGSQEPGAGGSIVIDDDDGERVHDPGHRDRSRGTAGAAGHDRCLADGVERLLCRSAAG